jgi:hypothetical protein
MGGMGPMGQPQAPMAPYGAPYGQQPGAPAGVGTLQSAGVAPGLPRRRNALMTLLLPMAVMFGGIILGVIIAMLVSPGIGSLLSMLGVFGGALWGLFTAIQMANELKAVTRNPAFAWWPMIVPIYQYYWLWFLVPQEVAKAKQMAGVPTPVRSIVLYIFLWPFALASDLNDLAR